MTKHGRGVAKEEVIDSYQNPDRSGPPQVPKEAPFRLGVATRKAATVEGEGKGKARMQALQEAFDGFKGIFDFVSGANDVILVKHLDGTVKCSVVRVSPKIY